MSGLSHRYWLTLLVSLAALLPLLPLASGAAPPASPPAITAPDRMPPNPHLPPDVLERMQREDAQQAGQWRFHEHPVRDRGKGGMANNPAAGVVQPLVSGTKSMACVLIKFPDQSNAYSATNFQSLLFTAGGVDTGSARDFYSENSYSQMTLTGQVAGWYTAANIKSYYGYNSGSARAAALAKEAAQQADAAGFNWAPYDNDRDGYVDALWMVHSGLGCEESGNGADIWSHSWSFSSAGIGVYTTSTPDPYHAGQYVKINAYITMPETSYWSGGNGSILKQVGIGVFCHEFGHALGLPDLYDTGGTGQGLGNASLMASGSWGGNGADSRYPAHLDAWSKADMGWLTPTVVTTNGSYTVKNAETNQYCYLVKPQGSAVNQYFLVENREHVGYDNTLFATGLFIYHVDTDIISSYRSINRINANYHTYGVALEEADATVDNYSSQHLFAGGSGRGYAGDSWPNTSKTAFTESSTPSTKTNAGVLQVCGITDMPAKSNTMVVNIYVMPANTPPVSVDDSYTTNEDTPLTVAAPGVLANDSDVDGNPLTAVKVTNPTNGTVTLNSDGSFTYTPNANFNGTDSFTYKANDGTADSNTATVTLNVAAVNDPPVAADDSYSVNEDGVLNVGIPGILGNDTDVEGGPLTATRMSNPANGFMTLNANGSFTYTPQFNYNGADSFTYQASDGQAVSNVATVQITVNAVNDAPVAVSDAYSTAEDTPLTIAAPGVLGNDTDIEGNLLTAAKVSNPANGTVTLNSDGSFTYTPAANFHGADGFTYTANDGTANSNVATVSLTVNSVNDPPLAYSDTYSTAEDTVLTVGAPGVLANDFDADGDPLTATKVDDPPNGTLTLNSDGSFTYTPNANYHGNDSFSYRVSDGYYTTGRIWDMITVTSVNDAPVAVNDSYDTPKNTPLTVAAPGVLGNDTDVEGDPLTAGKMTNPASGTVTLNSDGSFTYTPTTNFTGTDSFTYAANDGTANSNAATVTVNVTGGNAPPVAVDDSYTTAEDTPLEVPAPGILGNDSDPDGDPLTAVKVTDPASGTVTLNSDGSFTYTPNGNFNGTDNFTYTAGDGQAYSNTATVTLNVTAVNDVPDSDDDYYSTAEDTVLTVVAPGVLANDSDVDGDPLTAVKANDTTNGTVTLNSNGSLTYTPNANFHGLDNFNYRASDGLYVSGWSWVYITVTSVNDLPVAVDDSYSTNEDTPLTVTAPGVLGNDTDADGTPLAAIQVTDPANGTVTLNSDGSFTYTPAANFHGADSFTYKASDGAADSNVATVSLTVNSVNDMPQSYDDYYSTNEDTVLTVDAPGVLANDSDVDGDPLSAVKVNDPPNGTVTLNSNGSFTYTPAANFHGLDYFTYRASDGLSVTGQSWVYITVTPANDAPVAVDDSFSTNEDLPLTVNTPGVLGNDTDADGNPLTAVLVNGPVTGMVNLFDSGSFSYQPALNFHGADSFTYKANDGLADSNIATVTINVLPMNDSPIANDDSYSTPQETPLVVAVPGVLGNDTDPDGDTLSAIKMSDPSNGSLTFNADGSFTYTPYSTFSGEDSFTYQANDGTANSNVATVTINVTSGNTPPVAANDEYGTAEDTVLTVDAPGVLGNDTDGDGDPLTAKLVVIPASGDLVLNSDGSFTYTPNAHFHGADSFTYQANDGVADSNVATVSLTVTPGNDPPVAQDDTYSTPEDTVLTVAAPGVLGNDSDLDGDPLTANLVTDITFGVLVLNSDGSFTYTPNAKPTNRAGSAVASVGNQASFTYQANDGAASSNIATVTIDLTFVNAPPVAVDDNYTTLEDTPLVVAAPGVLGNDSDPDGDLLTAHVVAGPTSGTLALDGNGGFTYTPNANVNGPDSFTYQANDGTADSNTATVSITVTPVNDPPIADPKSVVTDEDTPVDFTLTGSDPDGDPLVSFNILTLPEHGELAGNTPGVTYTPFANYNGPDSFTFGIWDGAAASTPATVSITVNPVNDAPVANDDEYTTPEDTVLTVAAPGVLGNDSDIDGDPMSAHVVDAPTAGQLVLNDDGSFAYTPSTPKPNDRHGSMPSTAANQVSFTYQANDGTVNSYTATVTINLTFVNTPPEAVDDNYSVAEDATLSVDAPGVLGNDSDANGDPLTAKLAAGPASGNLVLNSDGGFTYTPDANFNGIDSFTYQANDGTTDSNTATVTITVTPVNDAPVAVDDAYTTAEDISLTVDAPGVLGNDTDVDGDPLTASLVTGPASGLLALGSDGSFSYTPDTNFNGADSFTYAASDGTVASNTATVNITITAVNDPPVADPQSVATDEDTTVAITLTGSDIDSDPLTFTVLTQPANGALNGTAPGLTYTPATNFHGADSFTFRVSDGKAQSASATVSITVNPVNDAPVAQNGSLTTAQDTPANGILQAGDVDGDPLAFSIVTNGAKGTAAVTDAATGAYTYTPNTGATGADSFTFKANDGLLDSNTATVTVSITPSSNPPTAVDDAYSTAEDTTLTVAAPGVLGNDSDPNGDLLTAVLVAGPVSGTLSLNGNGGFTYTPALNFIGSVSFTYKANDGTADSNTATVNITVTPVNDAPVVQNDTLTVAYNTPGSHTFHCSDVEGDPLTCSIVSNGAKGTVTLAGDVYTYTPNAGATGTDSFTFKANDGLVDSNVGTITVTIGSANRPPVALGDIYTTNKTGRLSVGGPGVLRNDWDWERSRLTAVLVAGPQHGTLTFNTNGSFTYIVNAGYLGIDSFTYQASDGSLLSDTTKVTIIVVGKKR